MSDSTADPTSAAARMQQQADTAADAIRAMNHEGGSAPLPAPLAYDVLAALAELGHRLPQTLAAISRGLERSLVSYEVYETDSTRDPKVSIGEAREHLDDAGALADQIGNRLRDAQRAIAQQSYHQPDQDHDE